MLTPNDDIQNLLNSHSIFTQLAEHELKVLESCFTLVNMKPAQVIFEEGDTAYHCYFILSGTVEVYKTMKTKTTESLAYLNQGDLFGHIAMIDRKERSANCKFGSSGGSLWSLSVDVFERLFEAKSPLAYKIIDFIVVDLSNRLRGATQQLSYARTSQNTSTRQTHSFKAAQVLAGHQYSDEELDQIEVVTTEFQQSLQYNLKDQY
jgi:CRP-like cAMP-binding protein